MKKGLFWLMVLEALVQQGGEEMAEWIWVVSKKQESQAHSLATHILKVQQCIKTVSSVVDLVFMKPMKDTSHSNFNILLLFPLSTQPQLFHNGKCIYDNFKSSQSLHSSKVHSLFCDYIQPLSFELPQIQITCYMLQIYNANE